MADNDSVGKISLDLEVTSDLGKQIDHVANNIGKQLEAALSNIGNIDIGKNITNSIEKNMEAMQKIIEKRLSQAIEKAMANMKAMKIPVEFDIPKNITMPKQKIGTDVPAPRGPPQTSIPSPKMPKIDMGNPEVLKSVIDNMAQSLSIVNAKIEQQQVKLADLKTSYNQAFDGARKNKLLEQILNTEVNINKLISQSDRLGFTLADLDKQFNMLGSSAKNAGTGVSEVDKKLKNVNNSASKASSGVKRVSNSTKDMHNNMNRAYGGAGMFIKSMFTWGLIFPMVIGGITSVGKFLGSTLMVNAQFANSLNQIRSNLWVAFMPIYEAILPALNSLMSALATATAYLASFISQLFGTTYNASFQSAKAMQTQIGAMTIADKQAKKTANSLGGVGKSAKKSADQTKKAAEEVTGALAGFDQINKLNLGNNKVDTPDTPKETTPAGSGVVTPITPMANMAPIEAATSGWADKFKNIMANLWKPFQQAWAAEGQNTINAAKHALDGILALLGAIGRSFYIVWTNGTGERILVNLLKILQDILNIIGDIGFTFANAWNKGDIGTQVIQSLANSLNNVLSLIDKMLQSVRRVWGKEGPKFADMFMQALKAGSGVIENMTQKLGLIWDNGGQHAFEGLVKLGLKVGELALFIFTNFVAPFVNWFVNMIAPAIAPVLDVLGKVFDKVSNLIDWLMSDGKPVLDVILKVVGSIFLAFKTWEGINTIATGVKGTIDNVRSTIDNVQKSVEVAGKGFSTFKGFVSDAASAMADYGKKVGDVILKMVDVTANLAKQILQWIAQTAKIVASTIATAAATAAQIAHNIAVGAWTIICGLATIATTALGTAIAFLTSPIGLAVLAIAAVIAIGILLYKNWDKISAFLVQCWNVIKNTAAYVWNGIKDFFVKLWDGITNTINSVWNSIGNFFSNSWKSITNLGRNIWNSLSSFLTGLWNSITKTINNAWNGIKNFLNGLWNGVINTGKSIWNGFSSFLSNLWGNIKSTASNSWNAFKNTVSDLVSNTVNNAKNTWNGLVDWFRNLPGTFRNLGRDMINALGDGIKNTVNSVVNIAKDLGDKILSKIKEIFGIHSPSREMFKVGNYFVQGFTNALKGNDIGSMVKSVFGNITSLAKGTLGGPLGVMLKPMIDSGAFGKIGGLLKGVADKGASFLSSMFGGSGGVSGNVSSWLQAAMAITGTPMQYLPMLSSIAQHESGGDPRSINLWDSNAMAGTPSKGLMQMIDETFNRWAMPGMNNIWNPIDNAVSSIRYMIGRYGSIANVPGIRNMAGGGSYVGYAKGTNSAKKGLAMTGEVGPEMIDFSGGEMVLNLKDTISLISSAVNTIGNIKNAIAGISTIQQPQLSMTGTSSSDTSNDINRLIAEIKELIEAIKSIKGDSHGGNNQPIPDINLDLLIRIGDTPFGKAVIKAINKLQKQAGKTLIDI